MLTIYLFGFGLMLLLVEFKLFRTPILFYFLNFTWGKSVTYIFIGLLEFFSGLEIAWIDIIAGVWFILIGICFGIARCMYRPLEQEHVENIIKEIQDGDKTIKTIENGLKTGAEIAAAGGKLAAEKYRDRKAEDEEAKYAPEEEKHAPEDRADMRHFRIE